MKIAVVTALYQPTNPWLADCLASVARQTVPRTHFLVCDGALPECDVPAGVQVLRLPQPHADAGNAARAIGSISAICQGFGAIAYLDADNWYEPDHLRLLLGNHERTQAAVCSCARNLFDLEGKPLGVCPETDGEAFADISCLFFTRKAFGLFAAWYLMPRSQVQLGSKVMWKAIKDSGLPRAHSKAATVNCRTPYLVDYRRLGKEPKEETTPARVPTPTPAKTTLVPSRPTRKQTVSLCMIVKNEERNLGDCLAGTRALFDEIIVVDTGSTDRTVAIARECGARVVDFPWVDSFSAARNEGLRHATGEWIFWLDADDRLDDTNRRKLWTLLRQLPEENVAFLLSVWSLPEEPTSSALVVDHVRLFRRQPSVGWRFCIHEQILPSLQEQGAKVAHTDIIIHHLGYQHTSARLQKIERNLRLLHLEHDEEPDNAFTLFNLAGSYLDLGQTERAIPYLQTCLKTTPAGASFLPKVHVLLAQSHHVLGQDTESLRCCQEGQKLFPRNVELWFHEGLIHQGHKDHEEARKCFETILELPPEPCLVGVDAGLRSYRTRHFLAVTYRALKQPPKAEEQWRKAITEAPDFGPAWLGLVELLADHKKYAEVEDLIRSLQGKPQDKLIAPVLRARLCLARRELFRATELMEDTIAAYPRSVWLRLLYSEMLQRETKDYAAAAEQLRKILEVDPNQKQAKQKLAKLESCETAART